ncbi:MAG: undecaprenyl-diphosphatase UppP [Candidatus Paceibacterota bacterium]
MTPLDSLILGIIEGFTEFLPISSTAHLILASHVLGLDQGSFVKTFEIAIQSGSVLAVLVLYWRKFLDVDVLRKLVVAFLPTAVIGLVLYKIVKTYFLGNIYVVLVALGIGGILLILFEKFFNNKKAIEIKEIRDISYKSAALVGLAQAVAIVPGVSRSAATIVGGLLLGMDRALIVEFSFLLAVPTILAATLLDLMKNAHALGSDEAGILLIGFVAAFVTAMAGIKFLLHYVKNRSFAVFGVYRIILVIFFVLILL